MVTPMRSAVSAVALGRDVRPRECPFRTAIDRRRRELAENERSDADPDR